MIFFKSCSHLYNNIVEEVCCERDQGVVILTSAISLAISRKVGFSTKDTPDTDSCRARDVFKELNLDVNDDLYELICNNILTKSSRYK